MSPCRLSRSFPAGGRRGHDDAGPAGLRPYDVALDLPEPASVPVTAIVLTRNEEANIGRCLRSLDWCQQRIVVDSGSTDRTVAMARELGADVVVQAWLGFPGQRNFALNHEAVVHRWVYFVDADEWVSPGLAGEIGSVAEGGEHAAYAQRFRLVFLGRWIRHCGWYANSWVVRLVRPGGGAYGADAQVGERFHVDGTVGRLSNDVVDEDGKGLTAWLHKHVDYARAEAARRRGRPPLLRRRPVPGSPGSLARFVAKEVVFPAVPCRPVGLFVYMYLVRGGLLDGWQGLAFCTLHAWHEVLVGLFVRVDKHGRGL